MPDSVLSRLLAVIDDFDIDTLADAPDLNQVRGGESGVAAGDGGPANLLFGRLWMRLSKRNPVNPRISVNTKINS